MSGASWTRKFAIVRAALGLEISTIRSGRRRWSDFGSIVFPVAQELRDQERQGGSFERLDSKIRLLFWSEEEPPHRFIRPDIPRADRARAIAALRRGRSVAQYLGYANCRICRAVLGSADLMVCDMVYPQKADHYLSSHDVWTPECDELLRRLGLGARL